MNEFIADDSDDEQVCNCLKYIQQNLIIFHNFQNCNEADYSSEIENDLTQCENDLNSQKLNTLIDGNIDFPKYVKSLLPSLTEDEQDAINKCTVPELKKLMVLNRTKNVHLVKIFNKIITQINRVNKLIWQLQQKKMPALSAKSRNGMWKLGYPYFKTKDLYGCTFNADVLRKRRNNELTRVQTPMKWFKEDQVALRRLVVLNYHTYRENEIVQKLSVLRMKLNESEILKEKTDIDAEIDELQKDLVFLKSQKEMEVPPLHCKTIDWDKISSQLNGKYNFFVL